MIKVKEMRRTGMFSVEERSPEIAANFFTDLKQATVELAALKKGLSLSARLGSDRSVRRLKQKIRS